MKQRFPEVIYGQRWQAETIISMLKRNFGSALRARSYHSQNREIRLRVLTHDLGILLRQSCQWMFYTERTHPGQWSHIRGRQG
jgi:hypothetical protein